MWIGGVRVIVFDDDDRLLMVRQHHEGRDIWMVPGGGIEEGETAVETAIREMKEETNVDVEVGRMIWHVEEVSPTRGQRFVNFFLAKIVGGELKLGSDPEFDEKHQRMREVRFVSQDEMQELENVFPPQLRDELWYLKYTDYVDNEVFRFRESI